VQRTTQLWTGHSFSKIVKVEQAQYIYIYLKVTFVNLLWPHKMWFRCILAHTVYWMQFCSLKVKFRTVWKEVQTTTHWRTDHSSTQIVKLKCVQKQMYRSTFGESSLCPINMFWKYIVTHFEFIACNECLLKVKFKIGWKESQNI